MSCARCWFCSMAAFAGLLFGASAHAADFEHDVAPILLRHCSACHNPQDQAGGLDLLSGDRAFGAGDSSVEAIKPGSVAESYLIERIESGEMPPEGKGHRVSADELATLKAWIANGAPWPKGRVLSPLDSTTDVRGGRDWWSLQAPVRPRLPSLRQSAWVRTPIDAFVLAKLEEADLVPSVEADRTTLIRRACFDLIGLPPSPEELQTFVADPSTDAYEQLVDRLLASPRYGERWARHWLDVVRFAESYGFEMNQARTNAWPFRDYVIAAFNQDKPYTQFILEQLAGDQVGVDVGTCYLVAGAKDQVVSPDVELTAMQRLGELDDMVSTTATAFLALTVGCAKCHDHKFDAVSQHDYYALQGIFAGVMHGERQTIEPPQSVETKPTTIYAGTFVRTPEKTYRLHRGESLQKREEVPPGAIASVGPPLTLSAETPEHERRLALARWIADERNPLTARVMVNRIWHYHFGQGLMRNPSDFGFNGGRPSHPELLDWLATEFMANGWRPKHIHRLIMLSSTYRQSSKSDARAASIDGGNALLWRFGSRRLEAEPIRDTMLCIAGNLDLRMGGPGFDLFEPNTNYVKVYNSKQTFGPAEFRRMIYMTKPRMQLEATFGVFDCPDSAQPLAKRNCSTTPLQALNLLNGPFVVEQADIFAQRLEQEAAGDVPAQIRRGFWLAYGRPPEPDEQNAASALVASEGLASFCRALLNSNELVFLR
jgi:hypothetical protein